MSKVIIIGGGPAGMAAAISASEAGNEVHIYEKNEKLGKKLFITGKGRCNLTNAADMKTVMDNVVSNPRFLFSAFRCFDNRDIMELVENAGCPLKTERGDRVFPVSDHSSDVIKALERRLKSAGVKLHLNTEVDSVLTEDASGEDSGRSEAYGDTRICTGIRLKNGTAVKADKVIIATGGLSYESTGSTGDGITWARNTGHAVTKLYPSLVPLETEEDLSALMGLSLKNITASIYDNGKLLYEEFGEMLFTHFGVSGPVILSASAYVRGRRHLTLKIDLKPALDEDKLDARLLRDFEKNINKAFRNSLGELLPSGLINEVIRQSGVAPDKKVNEITREERRSLLKTLKGLEYTVKGTRGFNEAIITQGGVSVKDIDPKTMESKVVEHLHFAGEVLDLDALTGGFNLQIAWSTGWAAGMEEI